MEHFLVLFTLTLGLYFFVSPIIGVLSLIPLGWWSYQKIKTFANETLKKALELAETFCTQNENLLKKWPTQVDVSIDDPDKWAQKALKRIEAINLKLSYFESKVSSWKEHPWIRESSLQSSKLERVAKLKSQKEQLQSKLDTLVEHIPNQVESLILKIKPDFRDAKQFVPHMEIGQLEKLTRFVNQYGSEQTKKRFAQNTNLINLFSNADFLYKLPTTETQISVPWGGYHRLEAQFTGWHNLIQGWMVEGDKKEALKALLLLLEGKLKLRPEAFEEKLRILGHDTLKEKIQDQLFLLLDSGDYLKLLKKTDQAKIADWYQIHKFDILTAKTLMEAIFKDPNTPIPQASVLERYFYLLEAATLISDIQSEYTFQNLVRNYFKTYEGDHPSAHVFLRFIPEGSKERIELTKTVLIKRLEWFIRVACSGIRFENNTLYPSDISLFNDDRVSPNQEAFRFVDEKIKEHPHYKASYNPAFDQFLSVYIAHGLCSAPVQAAYHGKIGP